MCKLKPCPFCGKNLRVRTGVNPYGVCDTEDCWLHSTKVAIALHDSESVRRFNTREDGSHE